MWLPPVLFQASVDSPFYDIMSSMFTVAYGLLGLSVTNLLQAERTHTKLSHNTSIDMYTTVVVSFPPHFWLPLWKGLAIVANFHGYDSDNR